MSIKRIFISDVHLGIGKSRDIPEQRIGALHRLILGEYLEYDELYLLGDIFELESFSYLVELFKEYPAHFIKDLIQAADVVIAGNHDPLSALSAIVPEVKKIHRTADGVLCLHGDICDKLIAKYPKLCAAISRVGIWGENYIHRNIERKAMNLADKISSIGRWGLAGTYFPILKNIAELNDSDIVLWGHTHSANLKSVDNTTFINCGTWIDEYYPTFIYQLGDTFELYELIPTDNFPRVIGRFRRKGGEDGK